MLVASDRYPFGAHERIGWLCEVFQDSKLQAPTVAVFAADLIKHASSQTGEAYTSLSRIAREYGMAREAVSRGVRRLLNAKKIEAVQRPGRTTVYKICLPVTAQSHPTPVTEQSQVSGEPVTAQLHPCDRTVTPPVIAQLHEPLLKPGTLPGLRKDTGETLAPAPVGAVSAANLGGDRFPDFWRAFPIRSTVAEAEQTIAELLAAGINLSEIVAGALRYRKYSEATSGNRRQSAKQWLSRQGWRDDWTPPAKKQKKAAVPKFNLDRLDARFTEARASRDMKKFNALYEEVYREIIEPHIWPDGLPPDDGEYEIETGRKTAACPACWDRLYGHAESPACCESMQELAEIIDEMDEFSDQHYAALQKNRKGETQ